MRRFIFLSCIILGATLVLFGLTQKHSSAQDDDRAEYVGSRECNSCHREIGFLQSEFCRQANSCHGKALIMVNGDASLVWGDFTLGEEVRTVQFPGEDAPRPFTANDVAFALGSGRYVQAYVYEQDRGEYYVFPAEWNRVTGEWQPFIGAENWPQDPIFNFGESCAGCHTTGYNANRVRWEDDGVECETCHGPGSLHIEAAEDGGDNPSDRELREMRETIVMQPDAQICGQCHSQGREPEDNRPFPVNYAPGMTLLDEDIFTLVDENDPDYWWTQAHGRQTNMQYNEWLKSAHANSLQPLKDSGEEAGDECLMCHSGDYRWNQSLLNLHEIGAREGDPPEPLTLETAEHGIVCMTCHDPHIAEPVPYFLPQEPYTLCTQCHTDNDASNGLHHPVQQMFEGRTVVENVLGVSNPHFTEEDGPDCVTCHMARVAIRNFSPASHGTPIVFPADALANEGLRDSCSSCHTEQADLAAMQALIDDTRNSVQSRIEAIKSGLTGDEEEWVGLALALIEGDGSLGIHNYRYTDTLLDAIEAELQATE